MISQEPIANFQTQKILYKQAKNTKEKAQRIKDIYQVATEEYSKFIIDILMELSNYFLENDIMEKRNFDEWAYYSILTASKLKIKEATPFFRDLFSKISRTDYRAHILYLIGLSEDKEFLPFLNAQLKYYNNQQRFGDVKVKDMFVLVEGCLNALEVFSDPSSFYEVFYAVNAYNERINSIAKRVRDSIATKNDAATVCDIIIKTSDDLNLVYDALVYSFESKSSNEKKIMNCNSALERIFNQLGAEDLIKRDTLKRIKNLAVKNLGELKATDKITIEALKKIGTEEAVRVLTDRLAFYIKVLKEGGKVTFEKEYGVDFMKEIVKALGDMNSKIPLPELEEIKSGDYFGKPLQNEAELAIKKILKK